MPYPGLQIDEIRLLRLSRNAPLLLSAPEKQQQGHVETFPCFSMFDYFDWLTVQKDTELDHMSCLGLELRAAEDLPLVSSQYLTLVTLKGEPKAQVLGAGWMWDDPFFCARDMEDVFAQLPFLSVILVTILPCPNEEPKAQTIPCIRQTDVDAFLKGCACELKKIVWETGSKVCELDAGVPQCVFKVYHCINSGNFCIAMRCRTPEPAYHIAMRVRAATLNGNAAHGFPELDCSTFSLMGTAYRVNADKTVEVPPLHIQQASRSKAALRLSVTNRVHNLLFKYADHSMTHALNGLYGRYDVTFQLDPEQFWQLYPWICAHKLGKHFPKYKIPAVEEAGLGLTDLLKRTMMEQGAQYINTRFLIYVASCSVEDNNDERRKTRQDRVNRENANIDSKINEVLLLADTLPYCQQEFKKCVQLLQDLWWSYSSLRYQDDSFINGNMLLAQIGMLLNATRNYIESIDPSLNDEMFYKTLVNSLRCAINSISHFQKLMLSINQQSIQAPNYEMQMHADMEKFVVAYTEFSRRFLAEHFSAHGHKVGLNERRQLIFPIITVDMVQDAIQATPLFLLPYHKAYGRDLLKSNVYPERILLSIEVPDISAFGNLYVTLPLICHELFHNFRVLTRDRRNDALAKFLLFRVSEYIVQRWIDQAHEGAVYTAFGDLNNELLVGTLVEQLEMAYRQECGDAHKTANIGVLISNILFFLSQNVFVFRNQYAFRRPVNSPDQIQKNLRQFCNLALDAAETQPPNWWESFLDCCNYLEQLKKKQDAATREGKSLATDEAEDKKTLSKQLSKLVDTVFLDILSTYTARIAKHYVILFNQFSSLEKQLNRSDDSRQAPKVAEIGKRIYFCVERVYLERYSPDRIDHWIRSIYGTRLKWTELLQPFVELCRADLSSLTEEQAQDLTLAWRAMDYAICDLCRTVKDADHLYLLLYGSFDKESSLRLYRGVCDHLLKQYHNKIKMKLEKYYSDKSDSSWVLHSAPQMQELFAPLSCDLEQEKMFTQSLERVLFSCSQKDLESLVNGSTVLYREVFADLGMCVALGLNCFGYLRVLARNNAFCKGCRSNKGASLHLERMLLVSQTLLEQGSGKCHDSKLSRKKLHEDCCRCFRVVMNMIVQSMSPAGRNDAKWRKMISQMAHLVKHAAYDISVQNVPAFPATITDFSAWISKTKKDSIPELYQQLQSLWNLVHLFNYLANALVVNEDHPLKEHFSTLQAEIAGKWREKKDQHSARSHVLVRVGEAYNNSQCTNIPVRNHKQFKDTLSFVLYYYYHSWNVYGHSFTSDTDFQQRLDVLMGGAVT